jgi:hypothetical protein
MRHGPLLRRILFGLILLAGLGLAQEPSTTPA